MSNKISEKIDRQFLIESIEQFGLVNSTKNEIIVLHETYIALECWQLFVIQRLMAQNFKLIIGSK